MPAEITVPPAPTFLSIVVPAYNYAAQLGTCINSVLPQLQATAELIVIDDGSTDETAEVLRKFLEGHEEHFRCIHQHNRGAGAARNHGLRVAAAPYVLFLDADDEMLPGTVDAICVGLRNHPEADLIVGGHITRRPNGIEKMSRPGNFPIDPRTRVADYLIGKRIDLCHGSFAARKALLEQRPYPESLRKREDIPVFAHLLAHARVIDIDHLMVRVNKHAASLRHRFSEDDRHPENFVAAVFESLPEECQPIRRSYAAQRYQSALRKALASRHWHEARQLLVASWRADWRQALRPLHVRKALRALLSG